jgi:hypothetical protein
MSHAYGDASSSQPQPLGWASDQQQQPAASSDEAIAAECSAAIFGHLFALLDRDGSGYADEADVVAGLQCQLGDAEKAKLLLARISEEGHVDLPKLRHLLEMAVPQRAADSVLQRHERVMRLVLAVVRDFERRATARGEFIMATKARDVGKEIRATEERRALYVIQRQHDEEREFLAKAQQEEAAEFNSSWKHRMEEFSKLAAFAIEEMRTKHENAIEEYMSTNRPLLVHHFKLHAQDKETLDAKRVLKKLALSGDFTTCERFRKHVEGQEKKDHHAALSKAEEELLRKVEVQRWHQRLELRGLMTKCERIRSEHRTQWEDGLARLVLAQKTTIAESDARHARESKRAHATIRAALEPTLRPQARAEPRMNLALLSPRRKLDGSMQRFSAHSPRKGGGGGPPASILQPPPLQRPSRMTGNLPGSARSSAFAAGGGDFSRPTTPNAVFPPRPFTSEHVPRRLANSGGGGLTARPQTGAR